MGVGSIFVATTLAPLVIVLASVSLQILTIGLEQLKSCECVAVHNNRRLSTLKLVVVCFTLCLCTLYI